MKIISSAVLVALFAVSNARFLDSTTTPLATSVTYAGVAYASTLNCGGCIAVGGTYCIQKAEGTQFNAYPATTAQTCIAAATSDPKMADLSWSCSNAFADRVYSKY